MSEKWTKGPWGLWSEEGQTKSGRYIHSVCQNDLPVVAGECDVAADEGEHVCIAQVLGDTPEEARVKALLVAAAPALYEALKWFIDDIDGTHTNMIDFDANVLRARTALRQARGEGEG